MLWSFTIFESGEPTALGANHVDTWPPEFLPRINSGHLYRHHAEMRDNLSSLKPRDVSGYGCDPTGWMIII